MTFNSNVQLDAGRASGGGGGLGRGAAIGGGGGLLALLLAIFAPGLADQLGIDTGSATSGQGQYQQQTTGGTDQPVSPSECSTGDDANRNVDCRVIATTEAADQFWGGYLGRYSNIDWREPKLTLFSGQVNTGCGAASSDTGPFYCPSDESMYFDTSFFGTLQRDFGAEGGPLAEEYIVAHEYGHHVQNVVGYLEYSRDGTTGATSGSVKAELQADCFAGMWAGHGTVTTDPESGEPFLQPISDAQLRQAIDAAASVGDDHIQEQARGRVDPHSFTHGTSEQRMGWFMRGYQNGRQAEPDIQQCNTFTASTLDI
ncbi:neutral zinc metallopeptidase [Micrococcus sp. 2A]|uniref:KPN_02809 family neutral zinc metallopeptidase n=1 Tax=unclassified Micrococcus TaxID=2620948 RepID=UPI002004A116|nr:MULTISPECIES: neutral zinc metallopeptidase [unclassified Micrococcus]MCK6095709.1 neutral zinc metallopeptidase [Micrococcus sp. EYE_212]MCK6171784.1 neutral zinc metallopeptidase [Micrococcus sp. EYE_162]MDX2340507.1 neutral zinc metallopeptidase [Micrococcus sp. M4NT]